VTPAHGQDMNDDRTFDLTPDLRIPAVGFGTYRIEGAEAAALVGEAIRAGYRHIDTAEAYRNEEGVGEAIRAAMHDGLSRDDLFVTTKLWPGNAAWEQPPKTGDAVIAALDASLARLGLDRVDLYLIHSPHGRERRLEQWRALVELQQQGKTRTIGVSNYGRAHLEEIRAAGLPRPVANQIELHPWSQKAELVAYLFDHGILPVAYSSLVPLPTWRAAVGQRSAKTERMRADGEAEDSPFRRMARKYGVSPAQVLLRWALQKGYVVLPKSAEPRRIRENIDLFSFAIDDDDMAAIAGMDRGDGVAWTTGDPTGLP